jgi:type II secretory pathway component PulK
MRRRGDRGVALVLAMLVLVLLSVLIASMTATSLHHRTLAENHLADLQNAYGTRAGYHQALLHLQADQEQSGETDGLHERWARPVEFELGRSRVRLLVQDSERFINLSRLVNDKGETQAAVAAQLRRLVRILRHPPEAAERIIDYIDGDGKGDFESRAKNGRLYNLEELLRVEGLDPEAVYGGSGSGEEKKGLAAFVTIWPQGGAEGGTAAVNVNTAPSEVLQALSDEMTPAVADAIVAGRLQPGADGQPQAYRQVDELKKLPGMTDALFQQIQGQCSVKSATFEARVRATQGNIEKTWVYVIRRGAPRPAGPGEPGAAPKSGLSLLASRRVNDFLSVRPPEEEK